MAATANLAQALGGGPPPAADTSEVPVEHLDYAYINKCSSGKELEQILKVLRFVWLSVIISFPQTPDHVVI